MSVVLNMDFSTTTVSAKYRKTPSLHFQMVCSGEELSGVNLKKIKNLSMEISEWLAGEEGDGKKHG